WPGNPNETVPALSIDSVAVDNTFWHGVTISALSGKAFDSGSGSTYPEQILNSTVTNVGDSADLNRIGILLQNINDNQDLHPGEAVNCVVSNTGVGIATKAFGATGIGDFENRNAAHNGATFSLNTVNNAAFRAYDIEFAFRDLNGGNIANFDPGNNAVGAYVNYGRPLFSGFISNGAKIGILVQNTTLTNAVIPIVG